MAGKNIDYWSGTDPVLEFEVEKKSGRKLLRTVRVKQLVHCGRTSRNQLKLPQHVALAPSSTGERRPVHGALAFLVPPVNATHAEKIRAYDIKNNAEVEPVIFFDAKGESYVTVGSDHADRTLEAMAGPKSKLWMPKVICRDAWLYSDVADHWDELILRMWGYVGGRKLAYMDDLVSQILPPSELIRITQEQCGLTDLNETVLFGGSVPFLTDGPLWAEAWDFAMYDPVLGRALSHHYDVELMWK